MQQEEYTSKPKELRDLFSPGSHLSDVPVDFRGMSYQRWKLLKLTEQAEEIRRVIGPIAQTTVEGHSVRFSLPSKDDLNSRAISTPRDRYGMKGF